MEPRARARDVRSGVSAVDEPPVLDGALTRSGGMGATQLVGELRRICGDDHVVTHPHQLRTYESDGLLQYAVTPGAVVLPDTAEQVQRIVRACHEAEVPWVARGAGSGLS